MRFVVLVGALVTCVHAGFWLLSREVVSAPDFTGQFVSVSYTPFDGSAHPDSGRRTTEAQIRTDLRALAPLTRMVRTYSSTG
jgi:exo-beta-1,3-glucanase (GH17 family)